MNHASILPASTCCRMKSRSRSSFFRVIIEKFIAEIVAPENWGRLLSDAIASPESYQFSGNP